MLSSRFVHHQQIQSARFAQLPCVMATGQRSIFETRRNRKMDVRLWSVLAMMAGLLALATSTGAFAEEEEESVELDQLPKAVVESIKKMFPDAEMKNASKEVVKDEDDDDDEKDDEKDADDKEDDDKDAKEEEDTEVVYEVTLSEKGRAIDVRVDEEGDIEEVERSIDLKELPGIVKVALKQKYPKCTFKSVEMILAGEDGEMEFQGYEVILETADKKEIKADVEVEIHIEVGEE